MKNNLLSKTCNNCSHKATNVDYCELYKEIILDVEMYAFGCDDMTDID